MSNIFNMDELESLVSWYAHW